MEINRQQTQPHDETSGGLRRGDLIRGERSERTRVESECRGETGEEEDENDGVPRVSEMKRGVLPSAAFYL